MRVNLKCALSIAVFAGFAAGAALRATYAVDHPCADDVWSTKKVMDKVHVGKQSLLSVVNTDLRKAKPDWKSDEKNLTEIIRLMRMLTKQKPPRGSQEAQDWFCAKLRQWGEELRQNVKEHRVQPARA